MFRPLILVECLPLLAASVWSQDCPSGIAPVPTLPVHVRDIVFTNAALLSAEKRQGISSKLREEGASANDGPPQEVSLADQDQGATNLADETAARVSAAYLDEGYLKVQVDGKPARIATDPRRYDIVIRVLHLGQQYRLGDLRVSNMRAFSEPELRDAFPLQRGEIFSREKIATGLEALRHLYLSQGYLNATPVPETKFDDVRGTIDLEISVDEGKQFRLGRIDILGVDPETSARLLGELPIKQGDVFSADAWGKAAEKLGSLSPTPVTVASQRQMDEREGTVTMVVQLLEPRPCPIDLSVSSTIELRSPPH
jgi:outer membrane translocation and assembly module TamA